MSNILEYEKEQFKNMDKTLCFIASMNLPSEKILDANGSIFMNIYAEGFAGKRYYNGVKVVDEMENECMNECLKSLKTGDDYLANVQMTSGCMSNITVYHALLKKGDTILAGDTASFSHISHGIKGSFLDTYFNVEKYYLNDKDILDYDEIERIAIKCKPKMIIAGGSNYSQPIDFKKFREIADKVGAYLMSDISHILGLCITGNHMSPFPYSHVVTSTLHKTGRGVRGAIIVYQKDLDKKIKFASIPGLWGGSHLNNTLAKLQTFKEMQTPEYKEYIDNVVKNTRSMCKEFIKQDIDIVSGCTQNHLFCLNLKKYHINGKDLADKLEKCGIIVNANAIPKDTNFLKPSGIRLGCASPTSRGLNEGECVHISKLISNVIKNIDGAEKELTQYTQQLCTKYPLSTIYPHRYNYLFGQESFEEWETKVISNNKTVIEYINRISK